MKALGRNERRRVTNLDENTITRAVLERIENTPNPRVKVLMGALIPHLHADDSPIRNRMVSEQAFL